MSAPSSSVLVHPLPLELPSPPSSPWASAVRSLDTHSPSAPPRAPRTLVLVFSLHISLSRPELMHFWVAAEPSTALFPALTQRQFSSQEKNTLEAFIPSSHSALWSCCPAPATPGDSRLLWFHCQPPALPAHCCSPSTPRSLVFPAQECLIHITCLFISARPSSDPSGGSAEKHDHHPSPACCLLSTRFSP